MRGRDGGGSTTSREMTSSSSGVRPNHQPTTATSEKVYPREKRKKKNKAWKLQYEHIITHLQENS